MPAIAVGANDPRALGHRERPAPVMGMIFRHDDALSRQYEDLTSIAVRGALELTADV
jgi:hypothetical protein